MAIKVMFVPVCDSPAHRGKDVPAKTLPPMLVKGKPRVIELCDEDRANLDFDEIAALYDKYGHDPDDGDADQGAEGGNRLKCPKCDYWVKSRSSLGRHSQTEHGVVLAALETELGETVEGRPLTHKCRFCELKFSGGVPQAQHERQGHPEDYEKHGPASQTPVVEEKPAPTRRRKTA